MTQKLGRIHLYRLPQINEAQFDCLMSVAYIKCMLARLENNPKFRYLTSWVTSSFTIDSTFRVKTVRLTVSLLNHFQLVYNGIDQENST